MSDTTNTDSPDTSEQPTGDETPGDETVQAVDEAADDTPADEPDPIRKARKEAAGYRERLRAAERERDQSAATITALQRQIAEREAARAGLKPAALWAAGYEPADLLHPDGTVSAELLADALADTRDRLGISPFHAGADQGAPGRTASTPTRTPTWGNLLNPPQ